VTRAPPVPVIVTRPCPPVTGRRAAQGMNRRMEQTPVRFSETELGYLADSAYGPGTGGVDGAIIRVRPERIISFGLEDSGSLA
jgi:hypothetical protein